MNSNHQITTETEDVLKTVAKIWLDILHVERVAPSDNFFKLGGDSLKAAVVMTHIQQELQVSLDPIEIFDMPVFQDFVDNLASMLMHLRNGSQ